VEVGDPIKWRRARRPLSLSTVLGCDDKGTTLLAFFPGLELGFAFERLLMARARDAAHSRNPEKSVSRYSISRYIEGSVASLGVPGMGGDTGSSGAVPDRRATSKMLF
jgi:hypothetical protein